MTTAPLPIPSPDLSDSLPASRIMRERDEAKRQLEDLRAAYFRFADRADREKQEMMRELAEARRLANQPRPLPPVDRDELLALRAFVREVWNHTECDWKRPRVIDDVRNTLLEFIEKHGVDCDDCEGSGFVRHEVDGFSDRYGHVTSTARIASECGNCREGRVPR